MMPTVEARPAVATTEVRDRIWNEVGYVVLDGEPGDAFGVGQVATCPRQVARAGGGDRGGLMVMWHCSSPLMAAMFTRRSLRTRRAQLPGSSASTARRCSVRTSGGALSEALAAALCAAASIGWDQAMIGYFHVRRTVRDA